LKPNHFDNPSQGASTSANIDLVTSPLKMDLNDIKNQVSNLTLYDLKAGFRKAQNGAQHTDQA
jgi:hypothetical protein